MVAVDRGRRVLFGLRLCAHRGQRRHDGDGQHGGGERCREALLSALRCADRESRADGLPTGSGAPSRRRPRRSRAAPAWCARSRAGGWRNRWLRCRRPGRDRRWRVRVPSGTRARQVQASGFHQCRASAVRASRWVTASPRSTCPSSCSSTTRRRSPLQARASSGSRTVGRSTPNVIGMPEGRLQHLDRMLDAEAAGKGVRLVLIGRNSRRAAGPPEHRGGREHLQESGGDPRHPQQHQGVPAVDGAAGAGVAAVRLARARAAATTPRCRTSGRGRPVVLEDDARIGREHRVGQPHAQRGQARRRAAAARSAPPPTAVHTVWRAAAERPRRR